MSLTVRMVAVVLIVIAAVLGSLFVFDAISFDTLKDNLAKLAGVGVIVAAASGLISLVMSDDKK